MHRGYFLSKRINQRASHHFTEVIKCNSKTPVQVIEV
jgi:hypothetical protein